MTTQGSLVLQKLGIAGEHDLINSASIDLAISNEIILVDFQGYKEQTKVQTPGRLKDPYSQMFVDVKDWEAVIRHTKVDLGEFPEGIWVRPGVGVLASTQSVVTIPDNMVGQILLKSSRARDFVQSVMAGFHDNGFSGQTTLEIYAPVVPIKLVPNMRVVQLRLDKVEKYGYTYREQETQKYMNQVGPTPSKDTV
jgi:deoxycytidine triphosphate deaminase